MKRMLGILELLLIAGKVNDLFFVRCQKFSLVSDSESHGLIKFASGVARGV